MSKADIGAALVQVSASTTEISSTVVAEKHNIDVIKHNLNEATLQLKELSDDVADNTHVSREMFADIDGKLDGVQEAAVQSMCQARKAEKQKPMFAAIEKMIFTVIDSLDGINDIIGELHVLAVNGAIQANRPSTGAQLGPVLQKVADMTKELSLKSKDRIESLVKTLKPYIETAKKLSVTNEEFFLAAKSSSEKLGSLYDSVQEIKGGNNGMLTVLEGLREKSERATANLNNIDSMTMEFASAITQTSESINEIQKAITSINEEYNHD